MYGSRSAATGDSTASWMCVESGQVRLVLIQYSVSCSLLSICECNRHYCHGNSHGFNIIVPGYIPYVPYRPDHTTFPTLNFVWWSWLSPGEDTIPTLPVLSPTAGTPYCE